MEIYTVFMDWKNQYCQNGYTIIFFSLPDMCVFPGIKETIVGMFTVAIKRIFLNLDLSNSAGNNSINKTGIYFKV